MYAENYYGGWCKISSWCFMEKFWDVSWVIAALINDALVLSLVASLVGLNGMAMLLLIF